MGKKGKKFIDKHRDVLHTFKVVARSQRDPLAADESAPQAVLHPSDKDEVKEEQKSLGIYFDDDYDYLQHIKDVREAVNWDDEDCEVYTIRRQDPQAGKKELRGKKLLLPSSAFESYVEEPIGLLNKAAPISGPQPELDPDVVAGLDDDEDEFEGSEAIACNPDDEDALPDDFVLMLNAEKPIHSLDTCDDDYDGEWEDCYDDDDDDSCEDKEMPKLEDPSPFSTYREHVERERIDEADEERDFSSDFNDSEDEDDIASLGDHRGPLSMKTESHFTSYSISSSVLPRNKGLSTLDDCFEEKFVREYQEEQVGALDGEEVEGWVDEENIVFKQAMEQSRRQIMTKDGKETEDDNSRIIRWITQMQTMENISDDEREKIEVPEDTGEKWDCESILTTASTLYNHPRTITDPPRRKKIAVDPHTGVPVEHRLGGLTRRNLAHHDNAATNLGPNDGQLDTQTLITSMSAISVRPPGETSEERRYRKKALKELRRERRIEKKMNRSAFKEEKKRQEKIMQNNKYNYKMILTGT